MESVGNPDPELLAMIALARALNREILNYSRLLPEADDASEALTFYCECGCLGPVRVAPAAFEVADGALIEDHPCPDVG
jgi:hypothetical protein